MIYGMKQWFLINNDQKSQSIKRISLIFFILVVKFARLVVIMENLVVILSALVVIVKLWNKKR